MLNANKEETENAIQGLKPKIRILEIRELHNG